MSERITEAELADIKADAEGDNGPFLPSRSDMAEDTVRLIAEVRRLRGLIMGVSYELDVYLAREPATRVDLGRRPEDTRVRLLESEAAQRLGIALAPLAAEARAIREEQGSS